MTARTVRRWIWTGIFGAACLPGCTAMTGGAAPAARARPAPAPVAAVAAYNPATRPVPTDVEAPEGAPVPQTALVSASDHEAPAAPPVMTTPPLVVPAAQEVAGLQVPAVADAGTPVLIGSPVPMPEAQEPPPAGDSVVVMPAVQGSAAPALCPASLAPPVIDMDAPPVFPRAEPAPTRRAFVDLSAAPCFGHAPDYSWISGQVEHSHTAKEWRIRYASVDETDRYGGRVVLIENQHRNYLEDGQYVRARGHLVHADAASGRAVYRIESFDILPGGNSPAAPSPDR